MASGQYEKYQEQHQSPVDWGTGCLLGNCETFIKRKMFLEGRRDEHASHIVWCEYFMIKAYYRTTFKACSGYDLKAWSYENFTPMVKESNA